MNSILIIEDDHTIRKQITEYLTFEGFDVLSADNGKDGLELAFEHLPNIIICDIMMPSMDGYSVLTDIRKNPTTVLTPFIFLTARSEIQSLRQGMNFGADDYLIKPIKFEDLLKSINSRLSKHTQMMDKVNQKFDELRTNISMALPHEFRTALNGVLGFSQMLLDNYKDLDILEIESMLQMIFDSGKKLLRLVENFTYYTNLLNYSKEQASSLIVDNPLHLINEIAFSVSNKHKRLTDLINNAFISIPIEVSSEHFSKLVEEIIDNAFKFSVPGKKVEITTSTNEDYFEISVKNPGVGMSPDQINNIGAFLQFDRTRKEQQGLGLGLAIVKRIAEMFDGKFKIVSCQVEGITEIKVSFKIIQ